MMSYLAWHAAPSLLELYTAIQSQPKPLYLIVCLPDLKQPEFAIPDFTSPEFTSHKNHATEIKHLHTRLTQALACLQFTGMNTVEQLLPDVHLWLAPPACSGRLNDYFGHAPIQWQTAAVPQQTTTPPKPWLAPPPYQSRPERVLIIGAGIAGASTARLLAEHGIPVTVLEAHDLAHGGSGNRQGLLYAKISPHPTEQTELLLAGYGYTRRLLERLLPAADCWGAGGVLHLNYDEAERKRHHALSLHTHHAHLYHHVTASDIQALSGLDFDSDGLFWPQGVWLNPPALIHALLQHPLIDIRPHTPLLFAEHHAQGWTAHTAQTTFHGSHMVYCMGAHSPTAADPNIAALPYRQIRGQTGVAAANAFSEQLKCAVSAASYISPAWQGQHCYGATFGINNNDDHWYPHEEAENRAALHALHPALAASFFSDGLYPPEQAQGHAALRCDSPDHLPMVGALGDIAAMQHTYAKLALDKNYRIDTPCPYLPRAYLNTAHGTRGLATAPLCAASLVADILNLPQPLSPRLRAALTPNRTVIRAIVRQQPLC